MPNVISVLERRVVSGAHRRHMIVSGVSRDVSWLPTCVWLTEKPFQDRCKQGLRESVIKESRLVLFFPPKG